MSQWRQGALATRDTTQRLDVSTKFRKASYSRTSPNGPGMSGVFTTRTCRVLRGRRAPRGPTPVLPQGPRSRPRNRGRLATGRHHRRPVWWVGGGFPQVRLASARRHRLRSSARVSRLRGVPRLSDGAVANRARTRMTAIALKFDWLEAAPSSDQISQTTMAELDISGSTSTASPPCWIAGPAPTEPGSLCPFSLWRNGSSQTGGFYGMRRTSRIPVSAGPVLSRGMTSDMRRMDFSCRR